MMAGMLTIGMAWSFVDEVQVTMFSRQPAGVAG
jgi:hypothetical protein